MSSKPKSKQYRAPCLCGCDSTSPTTIAAHGKMLRRRAKLRLSGSAQFVPSHDNSSTSHILIPPSHRNLTSPVQPEGDTSYSIEDPMDMDPPANESGPSTSSSSLACVWADRAGRPGREDEDLVPEPGSPELSEDEGGAEGEGSDECEFLTDEEETLDSNISAVHVEISPEGLLTTDFQLCATRAGTFLAAFAFFSSFLYVFSNLLFSAGALGSRRP